MIRVDLIGTPRSVLALATIVCLSAYSFAIYKIWDYPPFGFHQWREADSSNFVLNYAQDDAAFLKPKVHERALLDGIAVGEFPIVYYVNSFFVKKDDISYKNLRVFSIMHLLLATVFFYLLLSAFTENRRLRYLSTLAFVSNPLVFYYGLKIMPEIHYMAWGLAGAYLIAYRKTWICFFAGIAALSVACMIKPFAVIFLMPAAYAVALREQTLAHIRVKQLLMLLPVVALFAWNFYAKHINAVHGLAVFDVSWNFEKWWHAIAHLSFYQRALLSYGIELYLGFGGLLSLLVYLSFRHRLKPLPTDVLKIALVWFGLSLMLLFLFGAHHISTLHDYYGIILIPPLAMFTGALWEAFLSADGKIVRILGVVIMIGCASNMLRVRNRFLAKAYDYKTLQAEVLKIAPLPQRLLVLDATPVVKLTMLNRFGDAIPLSSDLETVERLVVGSPYLFVCIKALDPCAKFLMSKRLVVSQNDTFVVLKNP